jgi:NADPH:quinone reductase
VKEIAMESENGDRMKRVVVDRFGGPEVVKVVDDQVPQPGAGEVRLYGTASQRDRAPVERLSATFIDYRNENFLTRVRELTGGEGVDVVLDGFGGALSLRSFRALRRGGRLVVYGQSGTVAHGRRSWRGWMKWYATTATVALWGLLSPGRQVLVYRIQKLRQGHQWFPVAARRAHELLESSADKGKLVLVP